MRKWAGGCTLVDVGGGDFELPGRGEVGVGPLSGLPYFEGGARLGLDRLFEALRRWDGDAGLFGCRENQLFAVVWRVLQRAWVGSNPSRSRAVGSHLGYSNSVADRVADIAAKASAFSFGAR